jgi:uncharacterized membrane protein
MTGANEAWQDLRRRQFLLVVAGVAFFVVAFCSGVLSEYLHREWIFILGGALSFVVLICAGIYLGSFLCPRCHRLFFVALFPRSWRGAIGGACAHCGLHAYAASDESAQKT